MMQKISIVIPCFNEEMRLSDSYLILTSDLAQLFPKLQYEICYVNDGSTDNTLEILKDLANKNNHITVITYPENRGKGYAVRQGLLHSRYFTKLILDADGSIGIRELLQVDFNDTWHIIKGERTQTVRQPLHRIFAGKVWHWLVQLKTGLTIDSQAPWTLLRLPRRFYRYLKVFGFAYDVEILDKAHRLGYEIQTIPVDYIDHLGSKVTLKKSIRMFFDLLKI
jgi:dolichyl-phosphate beta-glucosyltransferase